MLVLVVSVLVTLTASHKHNGAAAHKDHGGASHKDEVGARQLLQYLNEHKEPAGHLKTSYGYPVTYEEANLGINRDSSFLLNPYNYESISSFSLERIPPRANHANGAGARGYFEVTHDVSKYMKVKHFNKIGRKTPILIRFSPTTGEIGSSELLNPEKGTAIKFYAEDGNMDLLLLNTNVFAIKNPSYAASFIHCFKLNPRTGLSRDLSMVWDFIANHPESLYSFSQNLSPLGRVKSYRNLQGHAIHTFQVENKKGETSFIKLNYYPDEGVKNFTGAEIAALGATNPDYHTQDLYDSISNGTYPKYTLYMQVASKEDIQKVKYDLFDPTISWPTKDFPNMPIGKLVLDKHVNNHMAEVEQATFNPGNLPEGMRAGDKLFESRVLFYRDTHIHRCGTGFNRIETNRPLKEPLTYNRDGNPPLGDNGGDSPNYYPNSFHGIVPVNKTLVPLYRHQTDHGPTNFWQVKEFINGLSDPDRDILFENWGKSINQVVKPVQEKILKLAAEVDKDIGERLKKSLADASQPPPPPK